MKQVITEAKRKKIAKALHDTGTISKIKYIAVGSGGVDENNEVLSPSETATALKHELLRKEYTSSQKISDTCYEYTIVIEANELVGEYISEIALIDEDNDIIAIANFLPKGKDQMEDSFAIQDMYLEGMFDLERRGKGLFFQYNIDDGAIGFFLAIAYLTEEKEFQIAMQIGILELTIGYTF